MTECEIEPPTEDGTKPVTRDEWIAFCALTYDKAFADKQEIVSVAAHIRTIADWNNIKRAHGIKGTALTDVLVAEGVLVRVAESLPDPQFQTIVGLLQERVDDFLDDYVADKAGGN